MPHEIRFSQQRSIACRRLFAAVVAAGLGCPPSAILHAQSPPVHGYITAVRPPDGFDVNGDHVTTTPETRFGPIGAKNPVSDGPMRDSVQIGAWVEVFGEQDRQAKTVAAKTVLFRDDSDRKLTGLGVIDKVISTAPELEVAADGYRIRVTPGTEIKFPRDVKSAADVYPGLWVLYEGKVGPDGLLVASKARFASTDHGKGKAGKAPGDSTPPAPTPQPPSNGDLAAKGNPPLPSTSSGQTEDQVDDRRKKILFAGDTYWISADQALKSRIRRVGMSLVPDYQKQLPEDDPSKIQFDFVVISEPMHEVHTSSDWEGLILVPAQLAARFRNNDQLAAVLADSIASRLQQRAPAVVDLNRATLAEAAGLGAARLVPLAGLAADSVYTYEYFKHIRVFQEQRWRVALELMAEAGYDPWQAPEAWRLAEPGKLPADTSKLKYPDRSGYQFAILNLVYKKAATADASEGDSTKGDADARK